MSVTWMHTNTDPQRDARQVLQLESPYKCQDVQGHVGDVHCMPVTVAFGQTWCNHVRISNCLNLRDNEWIALFKLSVFSKHEKSNEIICTSLSPTSTNFQVSDHKGLILKYLVDIMVVKDAVKVLVDVVEHVDHLHGGAVVAEGGESHNVAEIDAHLLK